jgi:hypothetical protein
MNRGIKRSIVRWIHLIFGIPILGYIYIPSEEIPNYAPAVRFVFVPICNSTIIDDQRRLPRALGS